MLVFRGSPKSSKKSIRYIDQLREEDAAALQNSSNQRIHRRLPKVLFILMIFIRFHFQYSNNLIHFLSQFWAIECISAYLKCVL